MIEIARSPVSRLCGLMRAGLVATLFLGPVVAQAETAPTLGPGLEQSMSPSGAFLAGQHAQNAGDLGRAADFLLPLLKLDPDNMSLVRRLFALLAAEGRVDEALPMARRLLAHDGPDGIVSLFVAAGDVIGRNYAAARDVIAQLPDDGLSTYTKPIFMGWVLLGLGQADGALAALEPLGQADGARALYYMHAALIAEAAKRFDVAEGFYRASLKDENGASIRLVEAMAAFYTRRGQADRAEAVVADFLATQGGAAGSVARKRLDRQDWVAVSVATPADGIAEGMFGLGNSIRGQSGGDTALFLGQLAHYLKPGFDMVLFMLGEVMEADRRHDRAIDMYRQIEDGSALYRSARLRIASAMDNAGRMEDAVETLQALANDDPSDPDPLIDLGDVYRGHEEYQDAVDAYDQAFDRMGPAGPQDWRLLYARGIALERVGEWGRAEKDFLAALEHEPDQPFILNYLGYSWIDQGLHLERALDMIRKAVRLRPTDGYIVDSLGWGLFKVGKYEEAVREMERAVELRPQDAIINDHLGDSYWMVGRKREARFQWHRSLSLDPDEDLMNAIQEKLKNGLPAGKVPAPTNG